MGGTYREYKNYGRVYVRENSGVTIMVTVDIGPRIIYYGKGGDNLMYEDIDRLSSRGGEFFDINFGKGTKWYNLGGHRLWKSPEDLSSYSVDTVSEVTETKSGAIFTAPPEKTTGLIKQIEIEFTSDGKLKVIHSFINTLDISVKVAIWALTVLRSGGTLILPLNDNDKGFLPARNYVFWSYSDYQDKRFNVDKDIITITQSKDEKPFKLGAYLEKARAGYYVDNTLFLKTFDTVKGGNYPDYGCNFESYTNDKFLECESLGELIELKPGEKSAHTEVWKLIDKISYDQALDIINRG